MFCALCLKFYSIVKRYLGQNVFLVSGLSATREKLDNRLTTYHKKNTQTDEPTDWPTDRYFFFPKGNICNLHCIFWHKAQIRSAEILIFWNSGHKTHLKHVIYKIIYLCNSFVLQTHCHTWILHTWRKSCQRKHGDRSVSYGSVMRNNPSGVI